MSVTTVPSSISSVCYVYAVLCRDGNGPLYVKFGKTDHLHKRLRAVAQGSPIPAKWFAFVQVSGIIKQKMLERELHRHFKCRKTKGEWFKFDPESDVDRRDFNDGCALQFAAILGPGYKWDKISVAAIDAWANERKSAFLRSKHRKKISAKARQQQAWRELDSYGK